MKRLYLILFVLVAPIFGRAQQQSASFTLEQCIQYALENSPNIKNAVLEQRIAASKVKETIGIGLPQIDGNAGAIYNETLPRFFATKERAANFAGQDPNDPTFLPGVGLNDVVASQNFFQLKAGGNAGLSINQIIFNGSYLVGLQATSVYKDLSYRQANQTREQLVQSVMKAFYAALVNRARISLYDNNIARVDSLFRNTKALNQNGFAERIDVDRTEVSLNNLMAERSKFIKLQQLTLEVLKFEMYYPMDGTLDIVGELNRESVTVDLNEYLKDWNYRIRPDYQVLEANRKLQNLQIKNKIATGIPSINFNASLGYSTQSTSIGGIFSTTTNITDNGIIGPDRWYPVNNYGVNVRVPIFSGLQRSSQVQQEKLKLQKIENNFRTLESSIDLEVKRATIMYQNAVETLEVQRRNMDLATNVANVTKIKYEQGVGSNLEVVDAESALRESQINFYNALYEALVAKTDLDKAFGKLVPQTNQN